MTRTLTRIAAESYNDQSWPVILLVAFLVLVGILTYGYWRGGK